MQSDSSGQTNENALIQIFNSPQLVAVHILYSPISLSHEHTHPVTSKKWSWVRVLFGGQT